jgi:hypothetical protein
VEFIVISPRARHGGSEVIATKLVVRDLDGEIPLCDAVFNDEALLNHRINFFARQGFQILFDMPVANDSFSMGCARLRSDPRGQRNSKAS